MTGLVVAGRRHAGKRQLWQGGFSLPEMQPKDGGAFLVFHRRAVPTGTLKKAGVGVSFG